MLSSIGLLLPYDGICCLLMGHFLLIGPVRYDLCRRTGLDTPSHTDTALRDWVRVRANPCNHLVLLIAAASASAAAATSGGILRRIGALWPSASASAPPSPCANVSSAEALRARARRAGR
jgi:hypothetical protein